MAVRMIIACDICGAEPAATTIVSANGTTYEVDLCEGHVDQLTAALAPFTTVARVTAGARSRKPAAKRSVTPTRATEASPRRADLQQVREWAAANGYDVKAKGRVPAAVLEAYDAGAAPVRRKSKR